MVELPTHLRGAPLGEATVSRQELSRHQRDRVISKVTPVFARRGYQETSVDDLLAAGKVGVGNFYSLFTGKEDCFLACFDRAVTEATELIDIATSAHSDWAWQAYLGLTALLGRLSAEPLAARLVLVESKSAGPEPMARYDELLERAVDWLSAGRRLHPRAARLPASFEQATISGLAFYLEQCLLTTRRPSAAELLAETAPLMFEPIIGTESLAQIVREVGPPA
jgi:AcrR family transcriptional regulator